MDGGRPSEGVRGYRFPEGFLWGVATAAFQYEGGETGSQWDAWERSGHIKSGDRRGLACDWWEHAERDFDLAQRMGLNALRLSIEWSRIEPQPGVWNAAAITRYRQMLRGLRERGIEPMVTLHHFTHPEWFEKSGAFLAADAVETFTRFVSFAVGELGDLCDLWCTINEPNVYSVFGYLFGDFPPGRAGRIGSTIRAQATLARAHAAAYREIHRLQPNARVGWALHYNIFDPARPWLALDRLVAGFQDSGFNEFFTRAALRGDAAFPFSLGAGDLKDVQGTYDYVGVNAYYRDTVSFDLRYPQDLFGHSYAASGSPMSDQGAQPLDTEVYPQGIARIAERVAVFGKPVYITENGVADTTDRLRPWEIVTATQAVATALARGVDVRGYFHWSLVDNFEWAEGWSLRFGLAALDRTTQARTLRPSGELYAAIARANALTAEQIEAYGALTPAQKEPVVIGGKKAGRRTAGAPLRSHYPD